MEIKTSVFVIHFFGSNERLYLKDYDYIEFLFNYENGPDF